MHCTQLRTKKVMTMVDFPELLDMRHIMQHRPRSSSSTPAPPDANDEMSRAGLPNTVLADIRTASHASTGHGLYIRMSAEPATPQLNFCQYFQENYTSFLARRSIFTILNIY
jgi:hypothetical protein